MRIFPLLGSTELLCVSDIQCLVKVFNPLQCHLSGLHIMTLEKLVPAGTFLVNRLLKRTTKREMETCIKRVGWGAFWNIAKKVFMLVWGVLQNLKGNMFFAFKSQDMTWRANENTENGKKRVLCRSYRERIQPSSDHHSVEIWTFSQFCRNV